MDNKLLNHLEIQKRYSSTRDNLANSFYAPLLSNSILYFRAAGFFRSSAYLLAYQSIVSFAKKGGKIQLITSPNLSAEDIEAIDKGYKLREVIELALLETIEQAQKNESHKSALEFLSTLVAVECLEIKIAFNPGKPGIFHDKLGLFEDENGNKVTFTGSVNETMFGWGEMGNHESIDAFCSWKDERERTLIHSDYLSRLWGNVEEGVESIAFPEIVTASLIKLQNKDGLQAAFDNYAKNKNADVKTLFPHQAQAIKSWNNNKKRGIFSHATGSGKTFTAISAIKGQLIENKPVIIIVPSRILLRQWEQELARELIDINYKLLLVGSSNNKWKRNNAIEDFTKPGLTGRIVLALLQSASKNTFLERVKGGDHLSIVIDEVHNAGSSEYSKVLSIKSGPRLGLSATPKRYGDPTGTQRLYDYFNKILDPVFTLDDAIKSNRLCRYEYFVHEIHLSDGEEYEWKKYTKKIGIMIAQLKKDRKNQEVASHLKLLSIQRSKIAKKAVEKIPFTLSLIRREFNSGSRWLIYCDDKKQLNQIGDQFNSNSIAFEVYHSDMLGDKGATLRYFENRAGILLAIKCLDEGVNIPSIDNALILASSKNPREFTQRRGRLLRKSPGKNLATIHDTIVLPQSNNDDSLNSLVKVELARAYHFAKSAVNENVVFQLRRLARNFNVDFENFEDDSNIE